MPTGPKREPVDAKRVVEATFSLAKTGGVEGGLAITLFKDGNANFLWSAGTTELVGNAFTKEEGVWEKTGPREITARSVDFNFLYPCESPRDTNQSRGNRDVPPFIPRKAVSY